MSTDIKALRDRLGISQRELGERLFIKQATVSRLERGQWRASGPLAHLIEKLAHEVEKEAGAA